MFIHKCMHIYVCTETLYIYIYIYILNIHTSIHKHEHTHINTHSHTHTHTYIYIYILNDSPYGKKNLASDLKMKIYYESLSRGKYIYILEKKRNRQPYHTNRKNQKTRNWLVKRKKNTVWAAKLKCKKCSILRRAK